MGLEGFFVLILHHRILVIIMVLESSSMTPILRTVVIVYWQGYLTYVSKDRPIATPLRSIYYSRPPRLAAVCYFPFHLIAPRYSTCQFERGCWTRVSQLQVIRTDKNTLRTVCTESSGRYSYNQSSIIHGWHLQTAVLSSRDRFCRDPWDVMDRSNSKRQDRTSYLSKIFSDGQDSEN